MLTRSPVLSARFIILFPDLVLLASGWPSWVRDHPWILWAALALGFALILWGIVMPSKENGESPVQSVSSGNIVGRDNSGKLIGHVEHYHEAPASSAAPIPEVPKPQPAPKPSVKSAPHEVALEIEPGMPNISYDDIQARWKSNAYDGTAALILWVMNPLAPVGEIGRPTPAIAAHLTLRAKDGSNATIPRAYWLEIQENEVVVDVGHRARVAVGRADYSSWIVNENPHRSSPFENTVFAVPLCFV